MAVRFFYLTGEFSFRDRSRLKHFISSIFRREGQPFKELNVIFCSDEYLLEVNRQFLKHDFYTDVVTFNLADLKSPVSGEMYISVDRVLDNSSILGTSFKLELHRVVIHGVLHLCGYRDKTKKDLMSIRSLEDRYLKLYFKSST